MGPRERVIAARVIEKVKRNSEYAEKIGISARTAVRMYEKK